MTRKAFALFDATLLKPAVVESFKKMSPRQHWRTPVMFVVYIGSILTTVLWAHTLSFPGDTGMRPG